MSARARFRYTRFLRDEVFGEWTGGELHVHCHVRGDSEWWLAPVAVRLFIFRREMGLVLDAFRFADQMLLQDDPGTAASLARLFPLAVAAYFALKSCCFPCQHFSQRYDTASSDGTLAKLSAVRHPRRVVGRADICSLRGGWNC